MKKSNKLNLGSGNNKLEGWTNVDSQEQYSPDVLWDLNVFPYPFPDNSFVEILLRDVLEHLDNPIRVLEECRRIAEHRATLVVRVPHAFSYANVTDITHKHNFTENSFSDNLLEEYGLLRKIYPFPVEFEWVNKWKKFIPCKRILSKFFVGIYEEIVFKFEAQRNVD